MSTYEAPHLRHWPKRLPRELSIPETSLWFNLEVAARRYPNKPATIFLGREMTYARLQAQATALAGWLQSQGVQRGDRVAIYMQNCPQYLVAMYGIFRADAVAVPVNPMNKADEFGHYILDPETKIVICAADGVGVVTEANERLPPTNCRTPSPPTSRRRPRSRRGCVATRRCPPTRPAGPRPWIRSWNRRRPRRDRTTSPCCPTRPEPPGCPRAACTRTAR